jgi:hypothetical protein
MVCAHAIKPSVIFLLSYVTELRRIRGWLGRGQAPYSLGSAYLFLPVSFGSASVAGRPASGRGKTGKERQCHNLLLLLNVMGSSLEAEP